MKNLNNLHLLVCLYPCRVSTSPNADKWLLSNILLTYVFNDLTLYYRSVVLKLVHVAEHLEVMGLFVEHHEILIYLIPLYEPGTILLVENMTILMCAV